VTHTNHRSDRPLTQYDHDHKNPGQSTYQPTIKIKNCNTHLGITIRWVEEQPPELILNAASEVAG
jgi:hypothetical protein